MFAPPPPYSAPTPRIQQSYSYPTLRPPEILQCMADLHIPLSEEDLARPTPQRLQTVYESFIEIFTSTQRDSFSQPSFAAMEILEYPDLHQESMALMSFYRSLLRLMVKVGIEDFSIRDLIKPEPGHVRRILSAVINFAKFREERLGVFEQCTRKTDEIEEQRRMLEQRNAELAERVNTLRLQRAEQEPTVQKLREANAGLAEDLRELKKVQTVLAAEIENLKQEKPALDDKMKNTQFLINNTKSDCTRLQSRIVQNPEKLKQAISDMHNTVQREKANVASLEKRLRELQSRMDMMDAVDQDVAGCIKLMEDCDAELKRFTAALQKVSVDKESIDTKQAEIRELNLQEQQLLRQLNRTQEKIARLEKHSTMKKEAAEAKIEKLKAEYQAMAAERQGSQVKIDENNMQVAAIDEKITALRKKMETEFNDLLRDGMELKAQLDKYQHEVFSAQSA